MLYNFTVAQAILTSNRVGRTERTIQVPRISPSVRKRDRTFSDVINRSPNPWRHDRMMVVLNVWRHVDVIVYNTSTDINNQWSSVSLSREMKTYFLSSLQSLLWILYSHSLTLSVILSAVFLPHWHVSLSVSAPICFSLMDIVISHTLIPYYLSFCELVF